MTDKNIIRKAIVDTGMAVDGQAEIIANAIDEYCQANYIRRDRVDSSATIAQAVEQGVIIDAFISVNNALHFKAQVIANAIADYCDANYIRRDSPDSSAPTAQAVDQGVIIDAIARAGATAHYGAQVVGNAIADYCDANYIRRDSPDSSAPTAQAVDQTPSLTQLIAKVLRCILRRK